MNANIYIYVYMCKTELYLPNLIRASMYEIHPTLLKAKQLINFIY